ncbi:hypothetical protein C8A05DRAFT_34551 [Staphylotrichum tortipilum]|uniref:Uncharacterized protein n=1 Tax=Staphylotrichum tortipilum TaxID=2831512 RepID=A0AAN6MK96_9PEZI|nr:hypothetical protein C8A05DRAFT_34551 [Staphylotrichum longicolle]
MALGRVEFTVLVAVISAFIIFTPERLALLRLLCFWGISILLGWHGYHWWERNPWVQDLVTALTTDQGLSGFLTNLAWDQTVGKAVRSVWDTFVGVLSVVGGVAEALFRLPPRAKSSNIKQPAANAPPSHHLALLVTTPPIHTYGPVSDRLYTTTPSSPPPPIRWSSTDVSARSVPPLLPTSLAFRRHFALCLVPEAVWKSGKMTVREKLQGGLYWDHGGGCVEGSAGRGWEGERVGSVNGVQVLGRVEGGLERCEEVYTTLMANWGEYRNIWWNDADLALALAYLLVEGPGASTCREIMNRLAELRKSEVTEARREAWGKGFTAGSSAFVGAWAVTLLTGGSVLPVTAPIMATSLSAGFGSGVVASGLQEAEATRLRDRKIACGRLERELPRLSELFA